MLIAFGPIGQDRSKPGTDPVLRLVEVRLDVQEIRGQNRSMDDLHTIADSLSPRLGVEHNELLEALAESMDERISPELGLAEEVGAAEISDSSIENQTRIPADTKKNAFDQ